MQTTAPTLKIDPFTDDFLTNPYPGHAQIRDAGAVVWLAQYGCFATARHEQVRAVFNDHATYISSAGVGLANFHKEAPFRPKSLILEADPPDHTRARSVLARILSPKAVSQIRTTFALEAEALVDQLLAKGAVVDGIQDLAAPYPLKVFPDAMGLEATGRENLLLYGDMVFNSFGPRNALFAQSAQRVQPITEWIMEHCQRAALRTGGFGDLIYQAADAGEISHTEAPMLVRSFLSAGVDTTVSGIGNALLCLAQHPGEYAKLHASPALARHVFEESLRYESAVQIFFRTASADTELAGVAIPAGSKILTLLGGANRDPRQWPEPEQFKAERRPAAHVAFGSGIHACVGQVLARLEGELVLSTLAKRVKRMRIAGEPVRRLNNSLRALSSLPLELTPV